MFDKFEVLMSWNFLEASLSCFLALVIDTFSYILQIIALLLSIRNTSSPILPIPTQTKDLHPFQLVYIPNIDSSISTAKPSPPIMHFWLDWNIFLAISSLINTNIAKGTTDPRVEFCLPKLLLLSYQSSYTNLDQISSLESWPSINFKISTKHQHFH